MLKTINPNIPTTAPLSRSGDPPSYRVFFYTGPPPKSSKYKKLIWARLGVSWTIYVNVDSPLIYVCLSKWRIHLVWANEEFTWYGNTFANCPLAKRRHAQSIKPKWNKSYQYKVHSAQCTEHKIWVKQNYKVQSTLFTVHSTQCTMHRTWVKQK